MKLSFTLATPDTHSTKMLALRNDPEKSFLTLSGMGYHGVELMVRDPEQLNISTLEHLANRHQIEISAVSTGQLRAEDGLQLCSLDEDLRKDSVERTKKVIDFAAIFKVQVNIGTLRGTLPADRQDQAKSAARSSFNQLLEYAQKKDITIAIEPQNRYTINWINNASEAVEWVNSFNAPHFKIVFDVYHWMLEEVSVTASLIRYREFISHIQFSDTNRLAPGWGHFDFREMIRILKALNYSDYISVECIQEPSGPEAASQAARTLLPLINEMNQDI